MNDIRLPFGTFFPPAVVDANGRRLRPGCAVSFTKSGATRHGSVVGWAHGRLLVITDDEDDSGADELESILPSEAEKVDVETSDADGRPDFFVEHGGPRTVVVHAIGISDVVLAGDEQLGGTPRVLPTPENFTTLDAPGKQNHLAFRRWTREVAGILDLLDEEDRMQVVRREVRAPILERVLQEAVLPRRLERLVFVVSNQDDPQSNQLDTFFGATILRHWLAANNHLVGVGKPDESRRWVNDLEVDVVTALPHVIDAVVHRLKSLVSDWTVGAERVVVVHGGGTPAMNIGVLLAAAQYSGLPVRHVQVPEPRPGSDINQPLIEMELVDMPELGRSLGG